MKKIQFIALIVLLVSFAAFGQPGDGWVKESMKTYSIAHPNDWQFDTSGQLGTKFIILSPVTSGTDQFRENVNLFVQDLTAKGIDLDKFVKITEEQIATFMTDGKILLSKRMKGGDFEYHKMIYTGKQGKFNLKFEQYYLIVGEKAYVLTLTCEVSQFDNYQKTGEKILDSFKFE